MTGLHPRSSTAAAAAVFAIAALLYLTVGEPSPDSPAATAIPVYVVTTATTVPSTTLPSTTVPDTLPSTTLPSTTLRSTTLRSTSGPDTSIDSEPTTTNANPEPDGG